MNQQNLFPLLNASIIVPVVDEGAIVKLSESGAILHSIERMDELIEAINRLAAALETAQK